VEDLAWSKGQTTGRTARWQGFCVGAALAAEGGAEPAGQRVTLDAVSQLGVGKGQGLAEGVRPVGLGAGARGVPLGAGPVVGSFCGGVTYKRCIYRPMTRVLRFFVSCKQRKNGRRHPRGDELPALCAPLANAG